MVQTSLLGRTVVIKPFTGTLEEVEYEGEVVAVSEHNGDVTVWLIVDKKGVVGGDIQSVKQIYDKSYNEDT